MFEDVLQRALDLLRSDNPWMEAALLTLCAFVLMGVAVLVMRPLTPHGRRWRQARRLYRRLRIRQPSVADLLQELRQIDPFVFEELVLLAFREAGYHIRRNGSYSGDGGIDGRMRRGLRKYYLQMKRYTGYVSFSQVQEFAYICEKNGRRGVFVHTGRTGTGTKEFVEDIENIEIVEGTRLWRLLCRGEDVLG